MKKDTQQKKKTEKTADGIFLEPGPLGSIVLSERAISSIIRKTTCSVPGIAKLTGNSLMDNLAELVGSSSMADRAIVIKADRMNRLGVEISVNIKYGCSLQEVASGVQSAVSEAVHTQTGLRVSRVDVIVHELEDETDDAAESQEETDEE